MDQVSPPTDTHLATCSVADALVAELEAAGIRHAFGVISLHNMPVLNAIQARGVIRFVAARGEAGAANMADAATRVSGTPALLVTSTGTGAGNAAGALVEALTAGTPLVHLTGQIDSPWLDRGWGFIHEAQDQLGMLRAVSKAAWRISRPQDAVPVLRAALRVAQTPPCGPVSIEIAIDLQRAPLPHGPALGPLPLPVMAPDGGQLARAQALLAAAKRPVLWVGGGAVGGDAAVRILADSGVPVVSSVAGRGILDEAHPASLGSYGASPAVAALLERADLLIVAGSHLRSNETRTYALRLPGSILRIDADPAADGRGYPAGLFLLADAPATLAALAQSGATPQPGWLAEATAARQAAEAQNRRDAGAYAALIAAVEANLPAGAPWVRDITLSNSIWGNRLPRQATARRAVHAMGGGIGQGLAQAIGTAVALPDRPILLLAGDGGFMLNPGELATAVQENTRIVVLLMNDGGYGVIRNIQDADYGGWRGYTDLHNPDYASFAASLGATHRLLSAPEDAEAALAWGFAQTGVAIIEVDMKRFGDFGVAFAGPPRQNNGHKA